jgi:hypothetical protein
MGSRRAAGEAMGSGGGTYDLGLLIAVAMTSGFPYRNP